MLWYVCCGRRSTSYRPWPYETPNPPGDHCPGEEKEIVTNQRKSSLLKILLEPLRVLSSSQANTIPYHIIVATHTSIQRRIKISFTELLILPAPLTHLLIIFHRAK